MTVQFALLAMTVGLMIEYILNWHIGTLLNRHIAQLEHRLIGTLKNKVLYSAKVLEICTP
jgi:hypothetical protein